MTDETGLAAAYWDAGEELSNATAMSTGHLAQFTQEWLDARLADPATVEAVARAMHEADPSLGVLGFGTHTNRRLATAALAVVRGLLGGTGGEG